MAVTFLGHGLCLIPACHRFVRFVDGEYTTADEEEIAVLAKSYDQKQSTPRVMPIVVAGSLAEVDGEPVKPRRGRPKNDR